MWCGVPAASSTARMASHRCVQRALHASASSAWSKFDCGSLQTPKSTRGSSRKDCASLLTLLVGLRGRPAELDVGRGGLGEGRVLPEREQHIRALPVRWCTMVWISARYCGSSRMPLVVRPATRSHLEAGVALQGRGGRDPQYLADIQTIVHHLTGKGAYVLLSLWETRPSPRPPRPTSSSAGLPRRPPGVEQAGAVLPRRAAVLFGVCNEPQSNFDHALDADA